MPRFDSTGPNGQGPLTGRKKGKCCKHNSKKIEHATNTQGLENQMNNSLHRNKRRFRGSNS